MDSLLKKADSMLGVPEPFWVPSHDQSHATRADGYDHFAESEAARLPMVRTYRVPAANASNKRLLTPREMEILDLLGTGLSVKGVARELDISPGTVKWHVKNIYYKLGASSREDALLKARLRRVI
jgi:DNA-binding NarL/FixJ family response regulator